MSSRRIALTVIFLAALTTTACGRDLRGFDEVEKAFAQPSGEVSASTASTIFLRGQQSSAANDNASLAAQFDQTGSLAFGLASMGQDLARSSQAILPGCATDFQFRVNGEPKKISVDCGSTGEVTGKLVLEFVWNDDLLEEIYLGFEMWCAGGDCVDGTMGFKYQLDGAAGAGLTTTFLATARVAIFEQGTQIASVDWAFRAAASLEGETLEWLVWSDAGGSAESWVLTATVTEQGGELGVRGANGSFTCAYASEAASGQCEASDGTSFTWTAAG